MPVNKNMLYRIRKIDEVLRTHARYGVSFDRLKEEVEEYLRERCDIDGVSERTLRSDFRHMEELYDVCIKSLKDGYYRYDPPDSSIFKSPITEEDADKLQEALQILRHFSTLPQFGDVAEILLKLEEKASIKSNKRNAVLEFDTVVSLKGIELLDELYKAASGQHVLAVDYQPFNEERSQFNFSPCYLREYNNRWFVFGRKNEEEAIVTLALDRIINLKVSDAPYQFSLSFVPSDYFNPIIGVTRPSGVKETEITLRVLNPRGQYVKTKPLHSSQVIIEEKTKHIVIRIKVIPNNELFAQLLSFGADLQVIKPKSIENSMKDKVEAMFKIYHS